MPFKKEKDNCLNIRIEPVEASFDRFKSAWDSASKGKLIRLGSHVVFESPKTLFSTFTEERMALLQTLRKNGPMAICELAENLMRDYEDVRTDIEALEFIGLVEKTEDGDVFVPWDGMDISWRFEH